MKLHGVWIVTYPKKTDEISDVCFFSETTKLGLYFAGGLKPNNIAAMFTDESEAEAFGWDLIRSQDGSK